MDVPADTQAQIHCCSPPQKKNSTPSDNKSHFVILAFEVAVKNNNKHFFPHGKPHPCLVPYRVALVSKSDL
jgi:hypothetical protein